MKTRRTVFEAENGEVSIIQQSQVFFTWWAPGKTSSYETVSAARAAKDMLSDCRDGALKLDPSTIIRLHALISPKKRGSKKSLTLKERRFQNVKSVLKKTETRIKRLTTSAKKLRKRLKYYEKQLTNQKEN